MPDIFTIVSSSWCCLIGFPTGYAYNWRGKYQCTGKTWFEDITSLVCTSLLLGFGSSLERVGRFLKFDPNPA